MSSNKTAEQAPRAGAGSGLTKGRSILKSIFGAREAGLAAALLALVIFLTLASPYFMTVSNLVVVSRQIALVLIIAIGMTFVIISGQIDLSVGSVVALTSVLTGIMLVTWGLPIPLAIVLALVGGGLVGLVNGVIFANTKIPAFVVTLGMLAIARGLALGITEGRTISGMPAPFLVIGQGLFLGVPIPVWIAVVVAILAHIVLTRSTFGRLVFFLGSNEEATVLSGIRVRRVKIAIFVIASTLAALSSVIETARLSVGQPAAGNGYELVAIGAVVIGGASLFGGEGSILGTVLGATLLALIQNGLILLGISAYWQQVFSGTIIILAVGLNMWRQSHGKSV